MGWKPGGFNINFLTLINLVNEKVVIGGTIVSWGPLVTYNFGKSIASNPVFGPFAGE
jgi:hypothetical protein